MGGTVKGDKKLLRFFGTLARKTALGVEIELDNQAQLLRGRAIAVAPELERPLILSAKVDKFGSGVNPIRVVSFDTPYAVRMHEDTYRLGPLSSQKSPTQDGPIGRKYLERPFLNMTRGILKAIGEVPEKVARKERK